LTDKDGFFAPKGWLGVFAIRKPDVGKVEELLSQVRREYAAQIERIKAAGLTLDHLDFEKHHGRRPALYSIACELASANRINIRSYNIPCLWSWRRAGWPGWHRAAQSAMLKSYWTLILGKGRGLKRNAVKAPDWFIGQSWIGNMTKPVWSRLLLGNASRPWTWLEGVTEIMTHPGIYDEKELASVDKEFGHSWIHTSRESEWKTLVDKEIVSRCRDLQELGMLQPATFASAFEGM
jgi:hypothetical protein